MMMNATSSKRTGTSADLAALGREPSRGQGLPQASRGLRLGEPAFACGDFQEHHAFAVAGNHVYLPFWARPSRRDDLVTLALQEDFRRLDCMLLDAVHDDLRSHRPAPVACLVIAAARGAAVCARGKAKPGGLELSASPGRPCRGRPKGFRGPCARGRTVRRFEHQGKPLGRTNAGRARTTARRHR